MHIKWTYWNNWSKGALINEWMLYLEFHLNYHGHAFDGRNSYAYERVQFVAGIYWIAHLKNKQLNADKYAIYSS